MKCCFQFIHFPAARALSLCALFFFVPLVNAETREPEITTTPNTTAASTTPNTVNTTAPEKETPKTDWAEAADKATGSLLKEFWNRSGHYFNDENGGSTRFNYWPQAHAMDVIIDAWLRTKDSKYSDYFEPWYHGIRKKNGNRYWNIFFDDMEWIALTFLRLHEATGEARYLESARKLWEHIQKAWDPENGGLAWKADHLWSKNACSNGPGNILASRLYQISRDEKELEWAKKIYQWEKDHLFDPETGAITDHYNERTKRKAGVPLSYNQGTFLGAAFELYQITGEAGYLRDAEKAATFTITSRSTLDRRNGILRDEGRGDGGLFKGIFFRYFLLLMQEKALKPELRDQYRQFLYHNAEVLWSRGTDPELLLFSPAWTRPPGPTTQLTSQTSACMLLEAIASYEKTIRESFQTDSIQIARTKLAQWFNTHRIAIVQREQS